MIPFLGLGSILGFIVCLIMLVISKIKKNMKIKKWGIGLSICLLVFIICISIPSDPNDTKNTQAVNTSNTASSNISNAKDTSKSDDSKDTTKDTTKDAKDSIPKEYQSALKKADTYANQMNLSKKGLYQQLTSDHGEKFPEEAAQYAIDNVKADWKKNALAKAKTYQDQMSMSKSAIHDQLVSDYGEKFTEEEAQYAINNLEN